MTQTAAAPRPKAGFGQAYADSMDWLRRVFPDEATCRHFLEDALWSEGRSCPHCGSLTSWPIQGACARPGLYECRDCRRQFTVTTKTPLHGTKLPLWRWIQAMWLMLSSSKGVSSVVMGRWIGVPQKTAWRMMHGIRELLAVAEWCADRLRGHVQVDTKFLGGAPRKRRGVKHKRGRGTSKPLIAVAVDGRGFVRSEPVRTESASALRPFFERAIHPSAHIVSDKSTGITRIARGYGGHSTVHHANWEFAADGDHVNTAEAFAATVERTLLGVYHRMSRRHLFRYVGEAACRWNRKEPVESPDGDFTGEYARQHPVAALNELFGHAAGVELRRSKVGGVRYPDEAEPAPRRLKYRLLRALTPTRQRLLPPPNAH